MGAIRVLAPRAWLIGLLFGVVLAGCGTILPSSLPTPAAQVVPGPTAGPVDLALGRIDPFGILRALDGGSACREEPLAGAGIHEFICPRSGNDRNIYFLFADAFQVELTKAGATLGTVAKESSDATAPVSTTWEVHGNASVGTARLLGVNGPGTLQLYVSLDLVTR